MKFTIAIGLFLFLIVFTDCSKERNISGNQNCDLNDYNGSWNFILNEDPSSSYNGKIEKFDESTINVTYQPNTAYNYFEQVEVDCQKREVVNKKLPAGNHGETTIEGTINNSSFYYLKTKIIEYGEMKDTTITKIVGKRI